MRLRIEQGDEAGFEKAREWLLSGFRRHLQENFGTTEAMAAEIASDAELALSWKFGYGDGHLGRWTAGDIHEFLLRWCPRKLSVSQVDSLPIPGHLAEFTDYLAAEGLLAPGSAPAVKLRAAAVHAADEFVAAMGDPANFGMAKSLFFGAHAHGYDLSDADQVDAWMRHYNSLTYDQRTAIVPDTALGLEPAGPEGESTPLTLPPVILPPDDVVEASMAAAPVLAMFAELARFAGAGRRLTQNGNLTLADARTLVPLLGTGDVLDEQIGNRTFATRSSAELTTLHLVFTWAKKAGVVRVQHGKILATKRGLALASDSPGDPAAMFDRALDALLAAGPLTMLHGRRAGIAWPDVDETLDSIALHLLVPPYGVRGPVPFDEIAGLATKLILQEYDFGPVSDEFVGARVGWAVAGIIDALALAGVVRRTGKPEAEPGIPDRGPGGEVELTPAGIATVQRRMAAAGHTAPIAGRFAQGSATELLLGADPDDRAAFLVEVEAWCGQRTPEQAVAGLAAAVREIDDQPLRAFAFAVMTEIDLELAAQQVRRLAADKVARGFALCWLADHDLGDPADIYDPGDLDSFAEALFYRIVAGEAQELLDCLALAGNEDVQARVVGEFGRSQAPAAETVLEAIAADHPAKAVAKAARKALFVRRSRQAACGAPAVGATADGRGAGR